MEQSTETTATWFVLVGDAEAGPFTKSIVQLYLEIGELSLDSMCWREGFPEWTALGQTDEFASHPTPVVQPPKPSLETPAPPAGPGSSSETTGISLPSDPLAHDDRNEPRQNESYVARFWRGEFSLPKSYWMTAYGLTALPIILAVGLWQNDFTPVPSRTSPVVVEKGVPQTGGLPEVKTAVAIAIEKPPAIKPLEVKLAVIKPLEVKPPEVNLAAIAPLTIKPMDIRPLDIDEGMRAISAIPIYAAIKEKYPDEYPKMEEVLRNGFSKRWSAQDLRAKILPFLATYYQKSLPTASPAAVEKFFRIVAAEQEAILQVNASTCMAYMKGDASGYSASDIPAEFTAKELEIGAEIIRSTGDYEGPAIEETEIQKSMLRVVSSASASLGMPVEQYLKGLSLKLDGPTNCEVFIAFYKHLADVTSVEKPKLLRYVVQSIMLPKA